MAAAALLQSASVKSLGALRELLGVNDQRERVLPELHHALRKLNLDGLDALEERLLSEQTFLQPWSVFRDNVLLLYPDAISRPTIVSNALMTTDGRVTRADILWFYTQFDEGALRYDPRGDPDAAAFTPNSSIYGLIDKSNWGLQEHEKHLFAWLLQSFKVGKARNPLKFHYLELKSICTIWEEIFVPIVNAVRISYDRRGRAHYGRFARLIEHICPSGLAFPNSNVSTEGDIISPTPYRIVSFPKQPQHDDTGIAMQGLIHRHQSVLKKKHYDETERELRDVHPQYGGLVERPKFKQKMEEWLSEQRVRAERRKQLEDESQQVNIITTDLHVPRQRGSSQSPIKRMLTPLNFFKTSNSEARSGSDSANNMSRSPIKRHSDSLRRSLSLKPALNHVSARDEEQKSPLHGVTRQLFFPDNAPLRLEKRSDEILDTSSSRRPPGGARSVGSTVSTTTTAAAPKELDMETYSSMASTSAKETTLIEGSQPVHHQHPALRPAHHETRQPSYEGTGYQDEISLTDLHAARSSAARSPQPPAPVRPPTRIPAPIAVIPYSSNIRVASSDSQPSSAVKAALLKDATLGFQPLPLLHKSQLEDPRFVSDTSHWANKSPPKAVPWPGTQSIADFGVVRDHSTFDFGIDETVTLPVPSKSPERFNAGRHRFGPRVNQLSGEEVNSVHRIVSIENIRSALDDGSSDSSVEDLVHRPPFAVPAPTMSPAKSLETYNTHHFPRKE